MQYIKNLELPLLQLHLEKELIALQNIETASAINDNLLKQWCIDILNSDSSERDFLLQLNRDNNIDEAYHSFIKFVDIYRKLSRYRLSSSLEAYVLMHDLLKPLSPVYHDKLISDILKDYDEQYNLWGSFGVIEPYVKHFYNIALRYHHILGVMIIGEMNYLVFEELFEDGDFQKIDSDEKKLLLEFLILHAAIDSAAIDDGYLSRRKAGRYFRIVSQLEEVCQASNRNELLRKMSADSTMERIEWLMSSYDPQIDIRSPHFYHSMLTKEQRKLLADCDFIDGMTNIKRITYGAKFLYCLLHRIDQPTLPHDLKKPPVGAQSYLHFMIAMSEAAQSEDYPVEIHFKNMPQSPDARYRSFILFEYPETSISLFNQATKIIRNGTAYLEVDLRLLF
ncbi:hypothetical protein GF337_17805 [candidate division KSB1 bacterium]|nr:hypothetical protein [candidate division KSB1 bacterium]